jgi:hypothetical protein
LFLGAAFDPALERTGYWIAMKGRRLRGVGEPYRFARHLAVVEIRAWSS